MATTKKPRSKVAASGPVAAKVEQKPMSPRRGRTFHVHLIEGATYSVGELNFTAKRPYITSDETIYEALKSNGRLRIDVREGGARR